MPKCNHVRAEYEILPTSFFWNVAQETTWDDGYLKKVIIIAVLTVFNATTAFADGLCGVSLSNDDLVGNYTIELGPGTLTVITSNGGQRVHPVPLDTGTATIALYDGVPILYSDDLVAGGILEISLRPAENAEKDINFLDDPAFPTGGSDDIAFVLDCENATDMPQLIGTGTVTGGGVVVPNSVQLLVYIQDDSGISAVGVYDSTAISEASGGKIVFHVRFSMSGT